jgi:Zn-dependent peptidase ImmA (M78 family)
MPVRVDIKSENLLWAIRRAGFNVAKFTDENPDVKDWIESKNKPTVKNLENFAKKVYVPFGYLLLDKPPEEKLPIPYFRTNKKDKKWPHINVYDTLMIIERRQTWLSDFLRDEGEPQLNFVGKFNEKTPPEIIINDIRKTLNLKEDWANDFPNWDKARKHLITVIEKAGIIVSINSRVGDNSHRPIEVEDCRGFVMIDPYAPFLFINGRDAESAQMFTLAHELAHLWIGHSAAFDFRRMQPADNPIEKLCDRIAAEFLVPASIFEQEWLKTNDPEQLAKTFKVSRIVALRRALDLNKINKSEFFELYNEYMQRHGDRKKSSDGGGDYYATKKQRIGSRFAEYINIAVHENKLLHRDAYRLTGMKRDTFKKFMEKYFE